ncbi:hypothetical protein SD427_07130 [Chryseobacterium sp. JJR-5R]|uniref:hypothetical protein n=1 Tax=Chryseobacterium sp. JJR-5R TaxID=3093923 RepID=UPI002A753E8C|nr:hypothetical protein [Chryseobacterium sp. JJR-5R]WPO84099.1 hypothetical protein SD427_07130 [Chryseobacterium sp. JJR-5R]
MQKNLYLIIILFSLSSCYTYQVKKQADPAGDNKQASKNNRTPANNNPPNLNVQQTPAPINVTEKLAAGKNFRINADGRSYKIIVDRWEGDSLVAHPVHHPEKTLKFHKNQINGEKIAEKRFSQPIADIITIIAYAGIGVLIWSLVR